MNDDGAAAGELRYELLRAFAVTRGWPAFQLEVRHVATLSAAHKGGLVGTYEYSDGSATQLSLEGDSLVARWGDLSTMRLIPVDSTSFFIRSGENFDFLLDDGQARGLRWSGDFGSFEGDAPPLMACLRSPASVESTAGTAVPRRGGIEMRNHAS